MAAAAASDSTPFRPAFGHSHGLSAFQTRSHEAVSLPMRGSSSKVYHSPSHAAALNSQQSGAAAASSGDPYSTPPATPGRDECTPTQQRSLGRSGFSRNQSSMSLVEFSGGADDCSVDNSTLTGD